MKACSVSAMRQLDKMAIEKYGIEDKLLMENAGEAVYFVIGNQLGIKNRKFVVICGIGNNGGDGLVIARKIHSSGGNAVVFILGSPEKFSGSARMNYDIVKKMPLEMRQIESIDTIRESISHCDAVIDAIFGTGLVREVGGLHYKVIELINKSGKFVFSVDIPSGVNGDTGSIMGIAVKADHTITFGLPKFGNILYPGYDLGGKLYVSHISFPPEHYNTPDITVSINIPSVLPPKNKSAHKGSLGKALFIAGAKNYLGAPYFAAYSFMKAGGGYSTLAAPESITPFIAGKGSEIVFKPQQETSAGSIAFSNFSALVDLASKMDIIVIGPGLSLHNETQKLVCELIRNINKPILIDGDGITAICDNLSVIRERKVETVLTPHLGEMVRISGVSLDDLEKNKIEMLRKTVRDLQAVVVMKGAHSLIGYPDGHIHINMSGNPGMATAGSGDVLTGTIAAMYGLGLSFNEAVAKGVFIHGMAGDLAALHYGEDGVTAQIILDSLPFAMKKDRANEIDAELWEDYQGVTVI